MMAEAANVSRKDHGFSLESREEMKVRGVTEVISFDDRTVILDTLCGTMEVGGDQLRIRVLNLEKGDVELYGKIDSVGYFSKETTDHNGKNGFLGKLFR